YTGLSGWIYVTADGVVYTLNTDTNKATLYYIPDSVTELIVPATISTTLDGSEEYDFTVTTVAKDAAADAANLTSVTFEDSSKITMLEAYALANAPISSITDMATGTTATTIDDATALFLMLMLAIMRFLIQVLKALHRQVIFPRIWMAVVSSLLIR
ncbi:MAG: hypothetical protein LUF68_08770, partial [Clostridiales bacterium]|nr:hypothetical protein [Clostridiales bacterium]